MAIQQEHVAVQSHNNHQSLELVLERLLVMGARKICMAKMKPAIIPNITKDMGVLNHVVPIQKLMMNQI